MTGSTSAPAPTGQGLFLVINPASGHTMRRPDPRPLIAELLPDARVHVLGGDDRIQDVLRQVLDSADAPTILGIYGGDGSVIASAEVAHESGLPLLVLPGGTFNHFALAIGVTDLRGPISALQRGTGGTADLAEIVIDGQRRHLALNTFSVGVYPDFVQFRTRLEPRIGRLLASVVAAARAAFDASPIELTLDGSPTLVWSLFIGVGRYAPGRGAPVRRIAVDDGLLDVRMLRSSVRARGRGFLTLAGDRRRRPEDRRFRTFDPLSRRSSSFTTARIDASTTDASERVYAHDGEVRHAPASPTGGGHRVSVSILPAAFRVFRPADAGDRTGDRTDRVET